MAPLIDSSLEQILKDTILPDLKKGRVDFDLPHTQAVVYWMKHLLKEIDNPNLDPQVLITAAYAHDWGYIGLFDGVDSHDIETIHKMKPLHMERGSKLIRKLIKTKLPKYFTPTQTNRTAHLVFVHDRMEDLKDEDEILLMEADTLGMLDTDRVKPTFNKEDNDVFIARELHGRRLPRFLHKQAKAAAAILEKKRLDFYTSPS